MLDIQPIVTLQLRRKPKWKRWLEAPYSFYKFWQILRPWSNVYQTLKWSVLCVRLVLKG